MIAPPMTLVVAADAGSRTGQLVAATAADHGHRVRTADVAGADAIVLVPGRGDAHSAVRTLIDAARRLAPTAHVLLVSSFAIGHGPAHALNRVTGSLPARRAAERALRASRLPWTVVRPTWLTDDPAGAHAVTATQDPRADGMLARADLAAALVAAVEHTDARGKTFTLFNEPGPPSRDWARVFAGLAT